MSPTIGFLLFVGLLLLPLIWAVGVYNRLVRERNAYRTSFAQIDVQLKRRHDLIPNLVETARAYMQHERETLEAVITARNRAIGVQDRAQGGRDLQTGMLAELASAEGALSGALGRLFALAEAYPDLKADANMRQLSEELTSTENRLSFARQAFNDAVMVYNNSVEQFPANLVAALFSFKSGELLEATGSESERQAPRVSF